MPRRSEAGEAHDVLVPEEFPIGTGDADTVEARARRAAPPDPSGPGEAPHDVLVPEEFPIGTGDVPRHEEDDGDKPFVAAGLAAVGGAVAALVLRRRRS